MYFGVEIKYSLPGVEYTLVVKQGEVEEPVTYDEFYMVGTFNEWNQTPEGGRLAFVKNEDGIFEAEGTLEDNAEFKIIVPDGEGWKWFGGVDENQAGFFLINNDLMGQPLQMVDGSNFRMEKGGKFTFSIDPEALTLTVTRVVVAGDVNGDGVCNASDVTALYMYILNGNDSAIVNGDQNDDGTINASDVTVVYNIILSGE